MTTLREALTLAPEPESLGAPLRVRVENKILDGLNRIEAKARGAGMRDVNRSTLVRAALAAYIERFDATQIEEN